MILQWLSLHFGSLVGQKKITQHKNCLLRVKLVKLKTHCFWSTFNLAFSNEELEFIQIRKQPCDSRMQLFHTSQHLQTHRDPICCAPVMIEWMLENRCAEVETALLARLSGSQGQLVELRSGDAVSKLMFASVLHFPVTLSWGGRVQGVGRWVYFAKSYNNFIYCESV